MLSHILELTKFPTKYILYVFVGPTLGRPMKLEIAYCDSMYQPNWKHFYPDWKPYLPNQDQGISKLTTKPMLAKVKYKYVLILSEISWV